MLRHPQGEMSGQVSETQGFASWLIARAKLAAITNKLRGGPLQAIATARVRLDLSPQQTSRRHPASAKTKEQETAGTNAE
jgi:hypothetical protein